jgi:predicted dehydrogenase
VAEVRSLTEASVKRKVVTQLGTQFASTASERSAVQLMKQGVVGKIQRVVMCANRPGAIENYRLVGPRPAQGAPPPPTLAWDSWLGCAPERPYAAEIYHPVKWRAWQDFGTGWSGDIGCHLFDAPWKGLGLKASKSVIAEVQESWKNTPVRRADAWPQSQHVTWIFPGNSMTDGDLTVEWFDGEMFPPKEIKSLFTLDEYPTESVMLVGTEGAMLLPLGASAYLLPEDKFKQQVRPRFENRNHYHHFVDACLGGEKTECRFDQSGPMAEAILLGTVAIRTPGKKLEWNSQDMRMPNAPEAEQFLRRKYRPGWVS